MKRALSVFLAALLCLLPASVSVYAATDAVPEDVYYVTLPRSYAYTVEPCEGYDQYVKAGDSFCFKVIPADGYGLDMALVYYYPTDVTNTNNGSDGYFKQQPFFSTEEAIYTIDSVTTDITISVEMAMQSSQSNFFRTLMEFIHMIFAVIGRIFGFDVDEPF